MANVGFKLGTQASVDNLIKTPGTSVVEGSFYLTSDTHRLYIGQKATADAANAQLFAVNEGVITVATISDLPTVSGDNASVYAGRFYYVTAGNILCVYNGKSWVQINANTDTSISTHTMAVTQDTTNNKVTVADNIKLTNNADKNASFTITGANGVKVTGSATAVTITGDTYKLSQSTASNVATIKLDSANTANDTSIKLKAGSNVTLGTDTNDATAITISSNNTKLTKLTGAAAASGFTISGTNSDSSTVTAATIDPAVKVGKTSQSTAKFVNGTATLDVYSTTDIDDKMKALNAMVYKGTLGADDGVVKALPTTNISIGDTYLVCNAISVNSKTVHPGSLVIARGTEGADGYITSATLVWDVVESTVDADTTYKFMAKEGGITLRSSGSADTGSLVVKGGTAISVASSSTSSADSSQTLTVNHGNVGRTDTTGTAVTGASKGSTAVTLISGVTTNAQGHVTGVEKKTVTLVDTNTTLTNMTNAASATDNIATVAQTINYKLGTGASQTATGSFQIGSNSMTVTGSGSKVNIDLAWGTF